MPETNFRPRCGTWHGTERLNCGRGRQRESVDQSYPDRFFTRHSGDLQLFDEVVVQALQEKDQLKINEIWDYIDQRQNHLTQHQNWRESVNDVLGRNPDIDVDDNKYYYLKTDAIMTLSLTREQLESLNKGQSCLVLLPQDQQEVVKEERPMNTYSSYETDDIYMNNDDIQIYAMT